MLVRTARQQGDKEQWLLFHKHDEHVVKGWDAEDHPRSVLSGRTNEEVQADPDLLWHSDLPAVRAAEALRVAVPDPVSEGELAALDALGEEGAWEVFGRTLRVTNLDKVLFPAREGEDPVTKRELIRYAALVAPVSLPYLAGRALNLHRFPGGASFISASTTSSSATRSRPSGLRTTRSAVSAQPAEATTGSASSSQASRNSSAPGCLRTT